MGIKAFCKQVFTGANNETLAIGRVLGLIIFVVFVLLAPPGFALAVAFKRMPAAEAVAMMDELKTYVPLIVVSVAALIAGTAFAEPKPPAGQ